MYSSIVKARSELIKTNQIAITKLKASLFFFINFLITKYFS